MTGILESHGIPCFELSPPGPDEPAQHQRLVVAQDHGRLRLPLDDVRGDARGPGVPHVVDRLLHVEGDHPLVADARRDGEDDAGVPVLDALGEDLRGHLLLLRDLVAMAVGATTCCCVTMGTEFDTLMTAFLFSEVMIVGLDSTVSWP